MSHIATGQLAKLCRRAATALRAGLDVRAVWQRETQRGTLRERQVAATIHRQLDQGVALADAMREAEGFFPPLACDMVDVGEQSGHLDQVLLRLARYYDHLLEVRRSLLRRIAWPLLQLVMGVGIVALLILVLGMLGSDVDLLGLGLGTGLSLVVYFLFILSAAGLVALLIVAIHRRWLGDVPLQIAMMTPVVSSTIKHVALSRFSMALGLALEAGMDVRQAVRLALAGTQNPVMANDVEQVVQAVQSGMELHECLRTCDVFPEEYLDMFETGERSGQLPEVLSQLCEEYERRAEASLKALAVGGSVLIWLVISALLIYVIIRLFITLYLNPIRDALEGI